MACEREGHPLPVVHRRFLPKICFDKPCKAWYNKSPIGRSAQAQTELEPSAEAPQRLILALAHSTQGDSGFSPSGAVSSRPPA